MQPGRSAPDYMIHNWLNLASGRLDIFKRSNRQARKTLMSVGAQGQGEAVQFFSDPAIERFKALRTEVSYPVGAC